MKRNKKLMLTAIAAMGVVAMGVGGAGTFAWYQAVASGASVANTNAADVQQAQTAAPGYTAEAVNLPIVVEVVANNANLAMVHYYDVSGDNGIAGKKAPDGKVYTEGAAGDNQVEAVAGFYYAYFKTESNDSLVYTQSNGTAGLASFKAYEVKVKVENFSTHTDASTSKPSLGTAAYWKDTNGTEETEDDQICYVDELGHAWSQTEANAALALCTVTFTVSDSANRAKFFKVGQDEVTSMPSTSAEISAIQGSIDNTNKTAKLLTGVTPSNAVTIGYFGLYIDGEGAGNNRDSSNVTTSLSITVKMNG